MIIFNLVLVIFGFVLILFDFDPGHLPIDHIIFLTANTDIVAGMLLLAFAGFNLGGLLKKSQ